MEEHCDNMTTCCVCGGYIPDNETICQQCSEDMAYDADTEMGLPPGEDFGCK